RNGVGSLSGGTFTFDEEPNTAGVQAMAPLKRAKRFYWQVYASNADGTTAGPVWSFVTDGADAPVLVAPDNASVTDLNPTLSWSAVGAESYDVFFGTVNPPPLVSSGQAASGYTPAGPLIDQQTYYWQIVAKVGDATTAGSVWSFTADATAGDILVLTKDVTTHDIVNTGAATTAWSYTVPGGTLSTDRALRLTVTGDYLNNSGSSDTFVARVKFGGVQIATLVCNTVPTNANRRALLLEALISAAGTTNAQTVRGRTSLGVTGSNSGSGDVPAFGEMHDVHNALTVDSTVNQTLLVEFDHTAANANL